jgi:hypothetical protein
MLSAGLLLNLSLVRSDCCLVERDRRHLRARMVWANRRDLALFGAGWRPFGGLLAAELAITNGDFRRSMSQPTS